MISESFVPYDEAVIAMESRVEKVLRGEERDLLWFLEHPPLYTAGSMSSSSDLINPGKLPVYKTNRGGRYTYHGPGQRVIYLIFNLNNFHNQNPDLRLFIRQIEKWLKESLKELKIEGHADKENIGIWIKHQNEQKKLASIGLRVKKWVTYHGVAININPNLDHFSGIIPCGIKDAKISSIHKSNSAIDIGAFDIILLNKFSKLFNVELRKINEII